MRKKIKAGATTAAIDKMPSWIEPCLATAVDDPPAGPGWLKEIKWDGYRLQIWINDGGVRLLTRRGHDWTSKFGRFLARDCGRLDVQSAIIDAEAMVADGQGISRISLLKKALQEPDPTQIIAQCFDLLWLNGEDLRPKPLVERRKALQRLIGPDRPRIRFSQALETNTSAEMFAKACEMGLEGIMVKNEASPYRSGRQKSWCKVRCQEALDFIVAGYCPAANDPSAVGSLVLAAYDDAGMLRRVGSVGTGWTPEAARDLRRRLDRRKTSRNPFRGLPRDRGVQYLEPVIVAEVATRGWLGSELRHASFRSLRDDKPAHQVLLERPGDRRC